MKNRTLPIATMALMVLSAACSTKAFAAGDYKPAESNTYTGVVAFKFIQDGTFSVTHYDGRKFDGTYTVSGDQVTLNGSEGGPCFGSPMTMNWTYSEDSLTLKNIEDTCSQGISFDLVGDWVPAE